MSYFKYIILSIVMTLITSSLFHSFILKYKIEPDNEKWKYIFKEKQDLYNNIIIFMQLVIFPEESKTGLSIKNYKIDLMDSNQIITHGKNDLKILVPRLNIFSSNNKIIDELNLFISEPTEKKFNEIVLLLRDDLFK